MTKNRAAWLIFGLLLVAQWLLFKQYVERELAWAYPTSWDQVGYLQATYHIYDSMLKEGPSRGLRAAIAAGSPTGILLQVQTAVLFLFTGANRISALGVTFAYFALAQTLFFSTIRRLSGRWTLAFLGLAVMMCAETTHFYAGGLDDFRLDSAACSLYGIIISLVIRSNTFVSMRWSTAVGAACAALVLLRFITAVYLFAALMPFAAWVVLGVWYHWKNPAGRVEALARLRGMLAAAGIVLMIGVPVMWQYRDRISEYYGHHVSGPEKDLRAKEVGIENQLDHWLFYPKSLYRDHLGSECCLLLGTVLTIAAIWFLLAKEKSATNEELPKFSAGNALAFVATSVLVPFVLLSLNVAKSPVVANILVPGIIWIGMLAIAAAQRATLPTLFTWRPDRRFATAIAAVALVFACGHEIMAYGKRSNLSKNRKDVLVVNKLYEDIGRLSVDFGMKNPRVSVDRLSDELLPAITSVTYFESHGVFVYPVTKVVQLIAPPWEEIVKEIDDSDMVMFTESSKEKDNPSVFPFNASMQEHQSRLKELCERDFIKQYEYEMYGRKLSLYMRPMLRLDGDSGGWITDGGITLSGIGSAVNRNPQIEVRGNSYMGYFKSRPHVAAVFVSAAGKSISVPASLEIDGNDYVIKLDSSGLKPAADEPVRFEIKFDQYFIPRELPKAYGASDDIRKLVVMTPTSVKLKPVDDAGAATARRAGGTTK